MNKQFLLILVSLSILVGCVQAAAPTKLNAVGLLVPDTVNDQVWGSAGYKGLLKIHSHLNVDVFYKEGMNTLPIVDRAVSEFAEKGVNLIFGHGNEYADYFNIISKNYPHIHFISFNGNATEPNTTSLSFHAHAMGYFGGMVAGYMTKTNKIGVIAAFEWQPEIEGFRQGVLYENPLANVKVKYTGDWDDKEGALLRLEELLDEDFDIVYPAGDGFNVPIIEKMKEEGKYVIGFVSDQSDIGGSSVLTSTIQQVDKLYDLVASQFQLGSLESGNLYFDFQDEVISLSEFSSLVDEEFQIKVQGHIKKYIETNQLPSD